MLKKSLLIILALCLSLTLWVSPASTLIALDGQFVAEQACEALQSIRTKSNPGQVHLTPQAVYPVIAKNRDRASHYLIRVAGAEPPDRWVAVQCGRLSGAAAAATPPANQAYLLALSWQPAFCETKPNKPECQSQTAQRFDATHLVLHGLWPQPSQNIYCHVSQDLIQLDKANRWSELPAIDLSEKTREALARKMPGFTSDLHLHEWYKHGTCYGRSPEAYFQAAIALLDQVNDSSVRDLFVKNIGHDLTSKQIRKQFDTAFTTGAGSKVQVQCQKDIDQDHSTMVVELQVNLKGNIQPDTPIATLLKAGQVVPAGCTRGEIDPAGFDR